MTDNTRRCRYNETGVSPVADRGPFLGLYFRVEMLSGFDHLRRAQQALTQESESLPRLRLLDASRHFWAAVFDMHHWPKPLQVETEQILALLLRHGVMEQTIRQMDDAEVANATRQLLSFIASAERFDDSD